MYAQASTQTMPQPTEQNTCAEALQQRMDGLESDLAGARLPTACTTSSLLQLGPLLEAVLASRHTWHCLIDAYAYCRMSRHAVATMPIQDPEQSRGQS